MFYGSGSYHIILSDECMLFLHNGKTGYCLRFFLAGYSEITKGITVMKILQGGPFRKIFTKLVLCKFTRNLASKLGTYQHLFFSRMIKLHFTNVIHEL